MKCIEWLKKVIRIRKEVFEKGWQRAEQEWVDGRTTHKTTFQKILSLKEYEPHKFFRQYLEEVRQLGIEKRKRKRMPERRKRKLII